MRGWKRVPAIGLLIASAGVIAVIYGVSKLPAADPSLGQPSNAVVDTPESQSGNTVSSESKLLPVEIQPVQWVSRYQTTRAYTGEIKASQRSQLSFEVDGRIDVLHVDEGDRVELGTKLGQLDTRRVVSRKKQLQAQLNQAKAKLKELVAGPRPQEIETARARVNEMQARIDDRTNDLQRQRQLVRQQATTPDELDAAISEYQIAVAQFNQASEQLKLLEEGTRKEQIEAQQGMVDELEASLSLIEIDLTDSQLISPYSGIITRRLVDQGQVVQQGSPVLELLSTDNWEATIGVPVDVARWLKLQQVYNLKTSTSDLQAQMLAVIPDVDPLTRTQPVRFQIHKQSVKNELLAEGQIVRLEYNYDQDVEGFWLPQSGLVESGKGLWACYTIEKLNQQKGIARLKLLEVLHVEAERVLVRGTLEQGEQVVVSGAHRIVPNQEVSLSGHSVQTQAAISTGGN